MDRRCAAAPAAAAASRSSRSRAALGLFLGVGFVVVHASAAAAADPAYGACDAGRAAAGRRALGRRPGRHHGRRPERGAAAERRDDHRGGPGHGRPAAGLAGRAGHRDAGVHAAQHQLRRPGLARAVPAAAVPGLGLTGRRSPTRSTARRSSSSGCWRCRAGSTLPVTVAAQTVQRSAFPDAYAKWEGLAAELVQQLADVADPTGCGRAAVPAGGRGRRGDRVRARRGRQAVRVGRHRAEHLRLLGADAARVPGGRDQPAAGVAAAVLRRRARAGRTGPARRPVFYATDPTRSRRRSTTSCSIMGDGQMVEAPYSGEPVRVRPVPWDYRGARAAGHPPGHHPEPRLSAPRDSRLGDPQRSQESRCPPTAPSRRRPRRCRTTSTGPRPGRPPDHLVVPRSLAQSMPLRWQQVFVGLLADLHDAYGAPAVAGVPGRAEPLGAAGRPRRGAARPPRATSPTSAPDGRAGVPRRRRRPGAPTRSTTACSPRWTTRCRPASAPAASSPARPRRSDQQRSGSTAVAEQDPPVGRVGARARAS